MYANKDFGIGISIRHYICSLPYLLYPGLQKGIIEYSFWSSARPLKNPLCEPYLERQAERDGIDYQM